MLRVRSNSSVGGAFEPAGDAAADQRAPAGDVAAVCHSLGRALVEPGFGQVAAVHGVDEREADAEDVIAEVADRALALGRDRVELRAIEASDQRLR